MKSSSWNLTQNTAIWLVDEDILIMTFQSATTKVFDTQQMKRHNFNNGNF